LKIKAPKHILKMTANKEGIKALAEPVNIKIPKWPKRGWIIE